MGRYKHNQPRTVNKQHPWPLGEDSQQHAMYAAERSVLWDMYPNHRKDMTLEECWTMANKLLLRKTFRNRYPITTIMTVPKGKPKRFGYGMDLYVASTDRGGLRVGPAHRGGFARHDGKTIGLAKWGRQSIVVLHELAHIIDMNENGKANLIWHQPHGWQFCRILLRCVASALGQEARNDFEKAMDDNNVRYRKPTKRQLRPNEPDPNGWVL